MNTTNSLISVADAYEVLRDKVVPVDTVEMALESAVGLTLAEPVVCDVDYPPFDKAIMDGFAVRSGDCQKPPSRLEIVGEIVAGAVPKGSVGPGQAMRINTGAVMPAGADAVVIIENTRISENGRSVTTTDTPSVGRFVAPRASCLAAGQVVLAAGSRLGPVQLGAAAAAGAGRVRVYRAVRLAILVTGDELVTITTKPTGAQIRDSNRPMLRALAEQAGCTVLDLGPVGDDRDMLREKIAQGLDADLFCVSGGISMGQRDWVPELLDEAGVELAIRKIAVKPGKPTLFGLGPAGQRVFGLPGNPVSSFVSFHLFVRAALAGMHGRAIGPPATIRADLGEPLPQAGWRQEYIPARLDHDHNGHWTVRPTRWMGSGDPFGLAMGNGLIVRPPDDPPRQEGGPVEVVQL